MWRNPSSHTLNTGCPAPCPCAQESTALISEDAQSSLLSKKQSTGSPKSLPWLLIWSWTVHHWNNSDVLSYLKQYLLAQFSCEYVTICSSCFGLTLCEGGKVACIFKKRTDGMGNNLAKPVLKHWDRNRTASAFNMKILFFPAVSEATKTLSPPPLFTILYPVIACLVTKLLRNSFFSLSTNRNWSGV